MAGLGLYSVLLGAPWQPACLILGLLGNFLFTILLTYKENFHRARLFAGIVISTISLLYGLAPLLVLSNISASASNVPASTGAGPADSVDGVPSALQTRSEKLHIAYQAAQAALENYPLTISHPTSIRWHRSSEIILTVKSSDLEKMKELASNGVKTESNIVAKLSDTARISIFSDDEKIKIASLTPDIQSITPLSDVTWRWRITGEVPGSSDVRITIFNRIEILGKLAEIIGPSISYSIKVEASPIDLFEIFIAKHGQEITWIIASVGGITAGLIWLTKPLRKNRRAD